MIAQITYKCGINKRTSGLQRAYDERYWQNCGPESLSWTLILITISKVRGKWSLVVTKLRGTVTHRTKWLWKQKEQKAYQKNHSAADHRTVAQSEATGKI